MGYKEEGNVIAIICLRAPLPNNLTNREEAWDCRLRRLEPGETFVMHQLPPANVKNLAKEPPEAVPPPVINLRGFTYSFCLHLPTSGNINHFLTYFLHNCCLNRKEHNLRIFTTH